MHISTQSNSYGIQIKMSLRLFSIFFFYNVYGSFDFVLRSETDNFLNLTRLVDWFSGCH